jgi:hypothetical protein
MGHANVSNISAFVNKALKHGPISIKEIVDQLVAKKQTVHASEGEYAEPHMLSQACSDVMLFLKENKAVEAVPETEKQRKILRAWNTDAVLNWDCGDDGSGGEYGIFDSIKWKALKSRLPRLASVTH